MFKMGRLLLGSLGNDITFFLGGGGGVVDCNFSNERILQW